MTAQTQHSVGLRDAIHSGSRKLPHILLAGGIEHLPEHFPAAAEFRVRRFAPSYRDQARINALTTRPERHRAWEQWTKEHEERCYLATRAGAATLLAGTIVNEGSLHRWTALRDGISGTNLFNSTNARLVISNVTGSPAYTDTTVANELDREDMDTGFPLLPGGTSGTATAADREFVLRSTFGATDAVGLWRRFWVVIAPSGDLILDNFSSSQGEKASGQVWELTISLRDS